LDLNPKASLKGEITLTYLYTQQPGNLNNMGFQTHFNTVDVGASAASILSFPSDKRGIGVRYPADTLIPSSICPKPHARRRVCLWLSCTGSPNPWANNPLVEFFMSWREDPQLVYMFLLFLNLHILPYFIFAFAQPGFFALQVT
jgi:hypothetical protein